MTTKTRVIDGHELTLEVGVNYLASRPMGIRESYDITIVDDFGQPAHVIPDLTYDQANEFINEFNNDTRGSFHGRTWR